MSTVLTVLLYYLTHHVWSQGYRPRGSIVVRPQSLKDFAKQVLGLELSDEEILRELSKVTYTVHDLRTPVTVVEEKLRSELRRLGGQLPCPWCQYTASDLGTLLKHTVEVHGSQLTTGENTCRLCQKRFPGLRELAEHYLTKHLSAQVLPEVLRNLTT